jgi:hypothetical protein
MFRKLRVTLICMLALLTVAAHAATLNVGPGQTYTTIQSAINAANDFDTVLVAPGTYTENIDLLGKWITVTSSGGAAVTIIDGSAKSAPAVTIELGGTHIGGTTGAPTFSGFTVQNGGTGAATKPTGGIYVYVSDGTISNNILTHNHCAGLWVVMLQTPPTVQNNEIDSTTDNYDCPTGGGSGIVVSRYGSGCVNCNAIPIPITGNTIQNNLQGGHEAQGGGGITILGGGSGAQIQNNTVRGNVSAGIGGGMLLAVSNAEAVQNLVYNNQAVCGGAGIATERTQYTAGNGTLLLASNTLYNNTLTGAACTATQAGNGSQLLFADEGSATYPAVVLNNIISGSSTQPSVACAFVNDAAAGVRDTPVFDHNLLYNSGAPVLDTASCTDPNALLTDLIGDPQFVSTGAFDFQLRPTSPAVDAGNNNALLLDDYSIYFTVNTTTDFTGNPRLTDATSKGYATIDIGAYELAATADTQQTNVSLGVVGVSGEFFLFTAAGGSSVNLRAVVSSPVGGATGCLGPVSFLEDGATVGSANIVAYTNTATLSGVFLAPGTHHFAASYAGQGPCSAGVSVQIIYIVSNYTPTLTLTSSPNPSILGGPVVFTATITSPDGSVLSPITLTDTTTNTVLATLTPNSAGVATFTTSTLPYGYSTITASYAGDAEHNSASASVQQQVTAPAAPTTTTLSCAPIAISLNATSLCTVEVTNALLISFTGSVTLTDNGVALANIPITSGVPSTYTYTGTVIGTHTLTATFPGLPGGILGSSASFMLAVNSASATQATTTSLVISAGGTSPVTTAPAGTAVTLTATVTPVTPVAGPTPTGTVTFYQTLPPTTLALQLGTAQVGANGVASLTLTTLQAGTDNITCTYSGDQIFISSSCNPAAVTITPGSTSLTLTSSANPATAGAPITFTMHLTFNGQPAPANQTIYLGYSTGTISPIIPLTTDATGTATYTLAQGLPVGNYVIDATFFATSTQSPVTASLAQQVIPPQMVPPDFTLNGSGVVTLLTTTTAAMPLTVASVGGFTSNIALTCNATIPQYVCSVAPGSVPLPANGSAVVTLTLHWIGQAQADRGSGGGGERAMLAALLPISLFGMIGMRRRRRFRKLFGLLCLAVMASAISACTTSYYPAIYGSYPVTVTATGGTVTHTLNVTANIVR